MSSDRAVNVQLRFGDVSPYRFCGFGKPGIVADTHCIRLNGRFGFYDPSLRDPAKVEKILSGIVPGEEQAAYCHRMVLFGREFCMARGPRCGECPLRRESLCTYGNEHGAES